MAAGQTSTQKEGVAVLTLKSIWCQPLAPPAGPTQTQHNANAFPCSDPSFFALLISCLVHLSLLTLVCYL
ncbi:hypothetical protein FVER53590_29281 [Fusarium verticillioides]|nr:hypothetical protein FVER53590_29281 [Fusarium verticillioides]